MELHHELAAPLGESLALQRLAELVAAQGDYARADELLDQALEVAVRAPIFASHMQVRIHATRAAHALDQGDALAAARAVEATVNVCTQFGECPGCSALVHPVAAETHAILGNLEEAEARATAAREIAEQWQSGAWRALAELAQGVAARPGEDAAQHLIAAADLFEEIAQPYPAAQCLFRAGQALAESGEPSAALGLLQRALAIFRQLGAPVAEARTRDVLARLAP